MLSIEQIRSTIVGPAFSILTPFDPRTELIDYQALEQYVNRIYDAGGRVFYVMAFNSRYAQLTFDEIFAINRFVTKIAKEIDPDNVVIVGDSLQASTHASIQFARAAEEDGADLISLIFRERHYSDEQVRKHFELIADRCEIPILIHEMKLDNGFGGPAINWPIDLLDRLADHPQVVAIKEDAKDDDFAREVVKRISDRVSIILSGGGMGRWLQFIDDGCQAWLNGVGVFEPKLATHFYKWYQAGEVARYQRIIDEVETPFFQDCIPVYGWHIIIKAALQYRGIMSRHDRMPLMPLNDEQYADVCRMMDALPIDDVLEDG